MRTSLQVVLGVFLLCGLSRQAQGQIPAKGYHPISYNGTVKLGRQADSMWGVVTMTAKASVQLNDILQHAKYLVLDSVRVISNGIDCEAGRGFADTNGAYHLLLIKTISSGNLFTVTTWYHGKALPEQEGTLHWGGVTDEDTMMFAMGVGFNAPYTSCTRHWMPCYDLPDDKPDSVDLTFICRDSDVTASNGLLVSNTVSNGWRTMHWHEGHPIATYLLTFATGPYTNFQVSNALNKPFEVYCLRRDSVNAATEMNGRVAQIVAFYDSLFAPYPFEKVGYVVTPFGSMEHQTMICLDKRVLTGNPATDLSDGGTVAVHELSHMWWGDRVTCETFDDAWLNEGFARFCESLVIERLFGRAQYINRQHNNIAGAKTSILPLSGAPTVDKHNSNYPYETIYQKGASVLGMLRQYLGDSIFFNCVRYYGNTHAYSTATSADLEAAFEHVSGQDLSWFWREWVYGRGYPTDTVIWSATPSGVKIVFHQRRDIVVGPDSSFVSPYFRVPIPVHFGWKNGFQRDTTLWMDSTQSSTVTANYGVAPDTVKIDPVGLVLMTTAKVSSQLGVETPAQVSQTQFLVYPNPDRSNELMYSLPVATGTIHFMLYDESGRTAREWAKDSLSGALNTAGLHSGSYRIVAQFGDGATLSLPVTIEH